MGKAIAFRALPMVSVVASSTAAGYDAANMANDHGGVVWKSAGGAASAVITVDMGSAVAIDTALFFGCTDARPGWTLTVEAADSGSFIAGLVSLASGIPFLAGATSPSHGRGVGFWNSAAATVAKRYWRFTIAGLDSGQVTVARLALGTKLTLERNFEFGGGWGVRDLGHVDFSARGVRLRRRAPKLRTLGLSFPAVRKDEAEKQVQPLVELAAGQEPVAIVTDPDADTLRQQRCWIGHLTGDLGTVWRTAAAWEWRANLVDLISIPAQAVLADPYAAYTLALDFDEQKYWVSGAKAASLASVSGYAFTRSGTQGAVGADGSVTFAAANAPAVNSSGFNCFAATTNLLLQSQALDNASWTKSGVTIPVTNGLAPDGNFTADDIMENTSNSAHQIFQSVNLAGATAYTASKFVSRSAGTRNVQLLVQNGAGTSGVRATFDLGAGTVSVAAAAFGSGWTATGAFIVNYGSYYRVVLLFTSPATAASATFAALLANGTATTYTGDGASKLRIWQPQMQDGSFPDGGPVIATTTATAGVGASNLKVGTSLPSGDFIIWIAINAPGNTDSFILTFGNTSSNFLSIRLLAGVHFEPNGAAAGVGLSFPATITNLLPATGGRTVMMMRRRNGIYSIAAKKGDGSIVISADASGAGAVPTVTTVQIGGLYDATRQPNGRIEGVFQRNGTFTDADITAILTAA